MDLRTLPARTRGKHATVDDWQTIRKRHNQAQNPRKYWKSPYRRSVSSCGGENQSGLRERQKGFAEGRRIQEDTSRTKHLTFALRFESLFLICRKPQNMNTYRKCNYKHSNLQSPDWQWYLIHWKNHQCSNTYRSPHNGKGKDLGLQWNTPSFLILSNVFSEPFVINEPRIEPFGTSAITCNC